MPKNIQDLLSVVDTSLDEFLILGKSEVHLVNLVYSFSNTMKYLEEMYDKTSDEKYKEKLDNLKNKMQYIKCNCKNPCDC